ncbi:MAG: polysaccharide biosynthesis tyrosine autokinase [Ferruginibacter sp.]|nr:polysaccharide biosynthesis tyrosine autokinase [Cytophagales bacterium]
MNQATSVLPPATNDAARESPDVKLLILRYLRYWPYFMASIGLAMGIAYFFNRYSTPRYGINATLLLKDTRGTSGANDFLEGFQLLKTSRNMENEIGIMRSHSMALATIRQLDFGVSYFKDGNIRTSELYGDVPIRVEVDVAHPQPYGVIFEVRPVNERQFSIRLIRQSSWVDDLLSRLTKQDKTAPFFREGTYSFGQHLEGDTYRFRLVLTAGFNPAAVQFQINSLDGLAWAYTGRVNVSPINKNSTLLNMSMQTTVPTKDQVYLNKFMETYIQSGLEEKNLIAKNAISFIDDQLDGVSDSLDLVEDRLQRFQTTNKTLDLSAESSEVVGRINELEKQRGIEAVKSRYYENLSRYVEQNQDLKGIVAPAVLGIEDELTATFVSRLVELYTKRNGLGFSAKDQNLYVAELDAQIQSLTQQLLENIRNVIRLNRTTRDDLDRRIRLAEGEIGRLPKTQRSLVNIRRKFSQNESLYIYLSQKLFDAGIAKASNLADSKVVDYASTTAALSPNRTANYRNAFLVGLLLPCAVIFLVGYLNDTINSREQLAKLTTIPILGIVTHSSKPTNLVVTRNPKSAVSETFRSLRSNLKYLASEHERKIILITSSISGEGKTFCAINLASVLALGGKKTLLMGVDLRKPRIFDDFGLTNEIGLSTYLIGRASREAIVQRTPSPFLDVVTAGPTAPNPAELLMNGRFEALLADLPKEYEFIVLDSPPLGLVADSFELMRHVDVVLYVVRQRYTKRTMLDNITELYNRSTVKNISLILNDFVAQPGHGHGYGYGYGYGYYEEDVIKRSVWKRIFRSASTRTTDVAYPSRENGRA